MAAPSTPDGKSNGTGAYFNVEAAIEELLANPELASLELPRMLSADQRKHVRALAERHPGLTCESYGLGADRRLHLFKTVRPEGVSVKNTFIDDWVVSGEVEQHPGCRSTPVKLPESMLRRCLVEGCGKLPSPRADGLAAIAEQPPSPGSSTRASGDESCSSHGSPLRGSPELPAFVHVEGLQVRNTFLHFEVEPADERIVRSLPHGMFRTCLWADPAREAAAGAGGAAVVAPAGAAGPGPAPPPLVAGGHAPGAEVVIEGLVKLPAFNGLGGVVESMDAETGRYNVLLAPNPGGHRWAKVKGINLWPALPPAPHGPPTLLLDACCPPKGHEAMVWDAPRWPAWVDASSPLHLRLTALV